MALRNVRTWALGVGAVRKTSQLREPGLLGGGSYSQGAEKVGGAFLAAEGLA